VRLFDLPYFRCAAAAAGLLLAGCGLLGGKDPGGRTTEGGRAGATITVDELDELTKSFADRYVNLVAEACDGIKAAASTPAQRRNAHRLKIQSATNAYDAVTGPDPVKQLVDLAVIVMIDHLVWVDERQAERFFGAGKSTTLTRSLGTGRDEMWKLCLRALRPQDLGALKDAVGEWRKKNPGLEWVSGVRFDVVTGGRGAAAQGILGTLSEVGGSIPDSVGQARLAAQRAFHYLKRLPTLLDWHAEAALENVLGVPELDRGARAASETLASASKVLAQASALMEVPPSVDGEPLPPRLREVRDLLSEGRVLAQEVRRAAEALAGLMHDLDRTETGSASEIRDYAAAGARFTEAAREATVLVRELRGLTESPSAPRQIKEATGEVRREARALVDHAAWRAGQLLVLVVLLWFAGTAGLLLWARTRRRPESGI
jgi:hypothetical protein